MFFRVQKLIILVLNICYFPKESSLKNSTRGPFGFECLSFTFCYLDLILTPYDLCPLLWWVGGWTGRIFAPIYLIFLYINKQNVLFSNMVAIGFYGFVSKVKISFFHTFINLCSPFLRHNFIFYKFLYFF